MDEINRLSSLQGAELNEVKKILATEVTAMLHGRDAAEKAADIARKTFEEGALSHDLPKIELASSDLKSGIGLLTLLVQAGLAKSNGEARRHVQGGGVRVNDKPVEDESRLISDVDLNDDGVVKLSFGKKRHVLIKPV